MNPELVENLKLFGLTDYEAKAYAGLCVIGTGSVTEVSQVCDVPRSNLYAVLESLAKKGFADVQKGRPVLFKATPPEKSLQDAERALVEKIKNAKEEVKKGLASAKGKKEPHVEPALIWGVRGLDSVAAKIIEIIRRSKKEVMINLPDLSLFDERVFSELERAKARGVETRIACEKNSLIPKFQKVATIRIREKIHGVDIIADDREVLVAPSFPIVAAWVDNSEMALHVKDFLTLVWKDAKVLK